jgi:hypothetical protein
MAPANEPPTSPGSEPALPSYPTGFQATPPPPPPTIGETAASASIPLPPTPPGKAAPPLSAEELAQRAAGLDTLTMVVVLTLAFLVSCFVIRNSDFLMHLATGRLLWNELTEGQFGTLLGQEPFSHTTEGVHWVNHSWLYDLLLYGLYVLLGGAGLVFLKAGLTTIIAWVMLLIRRAGQSLWAPVACTGLGILAASPRLLFQPTLLSMLFLGITLWLLTRKETAESEEASARLAARSYRHLWWLVPVFVLWVNMDSWFLLGPLTVALYLAGDFLQESFGPAAKGMDERSPVERRTLITVLVVGLLACLLNPHHIRAFGLPPQLAFTEPASTLQTDPYFRDAAVSPFEGAYFTDRIGLSVAGLSYFVLVAAGLASFALNGGPGGDSEATGWRWWRGLVWLAFFLLSAYHYRAIPFFAVIGAPITALNFQDYARRVLGTTMRTDQHWPAWSLGGRAATLLIGLLLLVLAWPGWLQASPREARRIRWGMAFDPSLQKAAETLAQWRKEGKLNEDDRVLNLTPDMANYFAWYGADEKGRPLVKGFLDYRFQPFPNAAGDYVGLRQAFHPSAEELEKLLQGGLEARRGELPWQQALRERGIKHVMLSRPHPRNILWMLDDAAQWTPLYLDGRTMIIGWSDPQAQRPAGVESFADLRLDPQRLAFGRQGVVAEAPRERPAQHPEKAPLEWWERYLRAPTPGSLASDEAAMHLQLFELQRLRDQFEWGGRLEQGRSSLNLWLPGYAAALVGAAAPTAVPIAMPGLFSYRLCLADAYYDFWQGQPRGRRAPVIDALARDQFRAFHYLRDDAPPNSVWLALRAARRGVHEDPSDPAVYQRLQAAYSTLQQSTRERSWSGRMPLLRVIRQIQIVSALRRSLAIDPEQGVVNGLVANLYGQMGYYDLAHKYLTEELRLAREAGRQGLETDDMFNQRIEAMDKRLAAVAEALEKRRNEYEVAAAPRKTPLEKAELALDPRYGLPEAAIDLLRPNIDHLSPEEARFLIELNLQLGELDWVRANLTEDMQPKLGAVSYGWHLLPAYDWFQVILAAASGDYQEADDRLRQIEKAIQERYQHQITALVFQKSSFTYTAKGTVVRQVNPPTLMSLFWLVPPAIPAPTVGAELRNRLKREEALQALKQASHDGLRERAGLAALRGMLALESGDTTLAAAQFEAVKELGPTPNFPTLPIAVYYLEQLKK